MKLTALRSETGFVMLRVGTGLEVVKIGTGTATVKGQTEVAQQGTPHGRDSRKVRDYWERGRNGFGGKDGVIEAIAPMARTSVEGMVMGTAVEAKLLGTVVKLVLKETSVTATMWWMAVKAWTGVGTVTGINMKT